MISRACEAGVRWVQLRMKGVAEKEVKAQAREALAVCAEHGAKLLINDHVAVAVAVGAAGVHVGQQDMSPVVARELLGPDRILGGTANTWEQMALLVQQGVDYIGLGPYRFTSSKDKLSPVLGLAGYGERMAKMLALPESVPVVAIGGIVPEDVAALRRVGVYGVAIAGAITRAEAPETIVSSFMNALE